jgi:hypothetical protein
MNLSNLQPLSKLSKKFGVKSIVYGGPGSGKTPIIVTAPRPIVCIVEPGTLSVRNSQFDSVPAFEADKSEKIKDFFKWIFNSNEAKQFDTIGLDSATQMAEIFLKEELARNKDGRRAYGEMARAVKDIFDKLYYLPNKHIYLIAKQGEDDTIKKKKPYFPGQELNVYVPHLFDEILQLGNHQIPGQMQPLQSFRCKESFDSVARDRSGNLAEFEPPDLNYIFNKCMQ